MFDFNEFQHSHRDAQGYLPKLTLPDGGTLSVQAGHRYYCTPRLDNQPAYTHVEVGFPSRKIDALMPYAEMPTRPTRTVYGWVPVEIINQLINGDLT
jgi:hypothetical protein